jgi:hypothetical protein
VRSGAKRAVGVGSSVVAMAAISLLALPGAAFAATGNDVPGTADITLGSLSMVTPIGVGFSATLAGVDQVATTNQALDIVDGRGSGVGWNVTLTSTQFTTVALPVRTLPLTAASDISAVGVCDTGVTCTLGDTTLISHPVAIPAAAGTAPTAVKIQTAAIDTGLGGQTWTHVMHLALAGNTKAGAYTSTWTYSLISAP